ncbi:hypothetical protein T492DRAFT_470065 [Pavlovales sp. CCMP2436]|nr:hypothetical protein T492DRAFT_470065 [Pavlovales sp. CCMP2436]
MLSATPTVVSAFWASLHTNVVDLVCPLSLGKTAGSTNHNHPVRACAYANGLRSTTTCSNLMVKPVATREHTWTYAIATHATRGKYLLCCRAACVSVGSATRTLVGSATSAQRISSQAAGSTALSRHTPASPRQTCSSSGLVKVMPRTSPSRKLTRGALALGSRTLSARAMFCSAVRPLRCCVCSVLHTFACLNMWLSLLKH